MKNISFIPAIIFIISFNLLAQQGWFEQTSGTGNILYSVYFLNENTGWISGEDNVIKKSTDGGQTWNNTSFHGSQSNRWYCIRFVNQNTGTAVGSTYNYDRWQSNWARTTDAGNSWEWQTSWGNDYSSTRDVFFLNENIGWKVTPHNGEGWIHKTTTGIGGFNIFTSVSEPIYSIWFVDTNNGWCVGNDGAIYHSSDGGDTWISQSSGTSKDLKSVCFVNSQNGWATGYADDQAVILKTVNGGQSWDSYLPSSIKESNSIFFVDANVGWVGGRMTASPDDKGVILYTSDSGLNWEPQHIDDNCTEFYSINFLNAATGWAVGSGGAILKTTTGGVVSVNSNDNIITEYVLNQNFPNPFNPSTKIKYTIPNQSKVVITVFDILGNEIETLVEEEQSIGNYEVEFDSNGLTSGIYFYRLKAGSFVNTKKMLLLK